MKNTNSSLSHAETILFLKMIEFRYPYLAFRETKLGIVSWFCHSEAYNGMPDHWMLVYLYRNQKILKRYLSAEYQNEA